MLYKTELKHTENERLSIFSNIFGCLLSSPRLFVLSFVLCLFLSFSVASADGMDEQSREAVYEALGSSRVQTYGSYLTTVLNECPYFYIMQNTGYSSGFAAYFTTNPIVGGCFYSSTGSSSYVCMNKTTYDEVPAGTVYVWYESGNWTTCYKYTYTSTSAQNTLIGGKSATRSTHYDVRGSFATMNVQPLLNTYVANFSGVVGNRSNGNIGYTFDQNFTPISYVDDDRLKLYTTQSASQGSLLHVDLSEFYQYNNGASSDYSFSDVVLTLDCDETEISFTLTPSGSQYEFLDTSTSSTRVYGYIVPYSFFSVSEYQNCSVVKVDFSRTISSPGGSGTDDFKISCSYPLKVTNINGNSQDFAPVTLAPVPSVTVAPDQSTVQDWSDNTSYHSPAFGHYGSYVLLNSLPIFPDWVDKYTLDCTRVSKSVDGITLNLWIDLDNPYISVNTALVDIPVTAFFTPESYLKDNVLTDFYDVVVFKVWSDIDKTSVDGYLYFYTEKYDLKYQNNLVVQELSLEYDSLNLLSSGFSLIRTGLDNIDNNTAAYFTDSLFNDTIVISWLQTLNNTNAFGFTDVVNAIEDIPQYDDTSVLSGIASVVSAIEGIDSPDLSDLESKLDTLINFFVADGSTENASSRTYRDWLRGVDDNTSRTVTYYADNVFSIVHDVFDLFDADGSVYYPPDSEDVVSTDYINFVKLFIEKMNSSTITNTGYNKYLRGFFQAGFDPHLIDGGL